MQVKDDQLELVIVRGHVDLAICGSVTPSTQNGPGPACRYINVELVGSTDESGVVGTVLLENPRGKYIITHKELVSQVSRLTFFVLRYFCVYALLLATILHCCYVFSYKQ